MVSNLRNKARQQERFLEKPSELRIFSSAIAKKRSDLLYFQRLWPCAKVLLQRANALQFLYVSEKGSRGQVQRMPRVVQLDTARDVQQSLKVRFNA
jgi:hypothetical protein